MSVNSKLTSMIETIMQFMPDRQPDPLMQGKAWIGRPLDRVDGSLKVTGAAAFIAEHSFPDLAHATLVCSTVANGKILHLDSAEAEQSPGVIAVITHANAPRMKNPNLMNVNFMQRGCAASDLPVLQDEEIHWNGQPVAIVVAATLEQAEHAASLVKVEYQATAAALVFDAVKADAQAPPDVIGEEAEVRVGDAEQALSAATFTVDAIYRTPFEHPGALELHATIASWTDAENLTVFDSTQWVNGHKHVIAKVFGLDADKVRVRAPFVGGGFGSKFSLWSGTLLCIAAARFCSRPVKLMLSREQVFRLVGGRTRSEQRVALAAGQDGKLSALIHTGITATTSHARYPEQFSFPARHLYTADNFFIGQKVLNLAMVANSWMRAPGDAMGLFALESAIDELADSMKLDPLELRRRNEPQRDPTKDMPFSSRHLLEAYELGAEKFGWNSRPREARQQREGKWLIGQGVAAAYHPSYRFPAKVSLRISADGMVDVGAGANEIGTGMATVQLQHIADRLGVPIGSISFRYGDTALPDSPIIAGGSSQTISVAAAIQLAVEEAHKKLLALASRRADSVLAAARYEEVDARNAGLFWRDRPNEGETYVSILQGAGEQFIEVEGSSGMALELRQYSMASYGAQFCEVRVHEDTGEIRVCRWVGAFDCGRILNPKGARSQLQGAIVMGIGAALMEEIRFDERSGRIMNPTLAEYHVPVHLDIPHIEVLFVDIPDERTPLGAHGVAEIGVTGAAAAIANAVFHATGKRIRELPITLDKLL